MKDCNAKEIAVKTSCIFGLLAMIFTIIASFMPDIDILTTFCVLFWVFCCLCLGIGKSVSKDLSKSKKIYPIEIV